MQGGTRSHLEKTKWKRRKQSSVASGCSGGWVTMKGGIQKLLQKNQPMWKSGNNQGWYRRSHCKKSTNAEMQWWLAAMKGGVQNLSTKTINQ